MVPEALREVLLELDRRHVWHPGSAASAAEPVHPVVRAPGVRLTLADGRELVDGTAAAGTAVHGYGHPRLDRALADQLGELAHGALGGLTHGPAVRLATRLARMTGLEKVILADSDAAAVATAVALAVRSTGRAKVLTVGGDPGEDPGAPPAGGPRSCLGVPADRIVVPVPPGGYGVRPGRTEGTEEPAAGPGPDRLDELAAAVARHAADLAAIVVEPVVRRAAGMRFWHPAYLRRLRELADEHGALLIADETATGFGRTGEPFGCDHAGIRPDVMCLGGALTGGYLPLAAVLCPPRVAERAGVLGPGSAFAGNPLAAAVANASLDLLAERPWREEVKRIEAALADGLAPAAALPGVADVRVLGAVGVIETAGPVDAARARQAALARGVWLRPSGRLIWALPAYSTEPADVARIAEAMVAACEVISR